MKTETDRLLELLDPAEPPADLAARAFGAAMAGESIIEAPSFWQRLIPVAAPAAVAVAIAALFLWLGSGSEFQRPAAMAPDEAGVAAALGDGELEGAVISALLSEEL